MRPPDAYAETPEGLLLIADGLGPVMRWDGSSASLLPVGVTPPASACVLAASAAADPRPAAPLAACTIAQDPAAAVPSGPAAPVGAPTLAAYRGKDVQYNSGDDPTTATPTFPPAKGLKGDYLCAVRYQSLAGHYSPWTVAGLAVTVTRADGVGYPPNTFALQYTGLPVPTDPSVTRRQLALNARVGSTDFSTGDSVGPFYYLDLDSADVSSTSLISNESVTRTGALSSLARATKIDTAVTPDPVGFTGQYRAYVRYYDAQGRYSDFSPVSNLLPLETADNAYGFLYTAVPVPTDPLVVGRQVLRNTSNGSSFYVDVDTTDLVTTSFSSTRSDAELLTQALARDAVATPGLSGSYFAYVRFINDLGQPSNLSPISNELAIGDSEVYGVTYSGVPVPTQSNVVRRQVLRNTGGQATTFYVDVDTTDLVTTSFSSTRLDDELDDQEAVPLFTAEGVTLANRFTVPPGHKTALAVHQGRAYMAVDRVWGQGGVQVTSGATLVTGLNADWVEALAGRMLYVAGALRPYQIAGVDVALQTLTLLEPYEGATDLLAGYQIRPVPAERRLVYYTVAGEMESWPAVNALSVPEDSDELTGLMQMDSFLFILEKRHVYRFTCQSDPAVDGFVFLSANRGCLNGRCFASVGGTAYMMDEQGVHSFDGSDPKDVSGPVQWFFIGSADGPSINWGAQALFHASLHVDETAVRFFICMSGEYAPRHALCFDYTGESWWLEEYDRPIGASTAGSFQARRRAFLGSSAERTYLSHESLLDGVLRDAGRTRGLVTAAALYSLTDGISGWPDGLVGQSVSIVSGRGAGQTRTIIGADGTSLALRDAWLIVPDTASVYQLGGVPWKWLSGWLRWGKDEEQVPRKFEIVYRRTHARSGNSPAALVVRVYRDFGESAVVWQDKNRDSDAEGFSCAKGGTDLVAVMDRDRCYAQQRMPGLKELNVEGNRYVSFGVEGVSSDSPQAVFQVAIDGAEG